VQRIKKTRANELNNGFGDLKEVSFARSSTQATAPPAQGRKPAMLVLVIALTLAVLHVILQAILSTAPVST
jgi:hypothetical protein